MRAGYEAADTTTPALRLGSAIATGKPDLRCTMGIGLLGMLSAVFMGLPLVPILRTRIVTVSARIDTSGRQSIVGTRSDRLDAYGSSWSPSVFTRSLAHLRQAQPNLRPYTYLLAKPALIHVGNSPDEDPIPTQVALLNEGRVSASDAALPGVALNVTSFGRTRLAPPDRHVVVFQDGDEPQKILSAAGLDEADAAAVAALLTQEALDGGISFAGGDLVEFFGRTAQPFRVSILRRARVLAAAALRDSGSYAIVEKETAEATDESRSSQAPIDLSSGDNAITIRQALLALVDEGKLDRSLYDDIVRVCSREFDLGTTAGRNDTVTVLFSPETTDGRPQPELAFVSVVSGGREWRFYRFAAASDPSDPDFFDASGRSVSKFLLRKPVAAGRLGDGFGWRIHPVLGDRRFHEGVDYAAPFGSPIVAAGAGTIEKIDTQWGYGKYIRIRHDQGYETTYAHVSTFAPDMRVGARVRQGETIAYVGSTGLSTGPHLYYEVRINGHDVDPLRVRLAAGPVLRGDALTSFESRKARLDRLLVAADEGRT